MFCWEALKPGFLFKTLSTVKSYRSSNEVSEKARKQSATLNAFLFLFHSRNRLIVAVSYNLWISADHRCRLVSWGVFLIKRQMSGGGRFALWHYKSWHHFKILCLLCCPQRSREIVGAKSNTFLPSSSQRRASLSLPSSAKLFRPTPVLRRRILRSRRVRGLVRSWKSSMMIASSTFIVVTVASKNLRNKKRWHFLPQTTPCCMPIWALCSVHIGTVGIKNVAAHHENKHSLYFVCWLVWELHKGNKCKGIGLHM